MISFENDYSEGCHEQILKRLYSENMKQEPGYGFDSYTTKAADNIKKAFDIPEAKVAFLAGGTQTNQIVISSILKQYEGVISPQTGHINGHEAGAIEYSGHKVLALPAFEGKIHAKQVDEYIDDFFADSTHAHCVFPGMVYISYPTEYGTLYSKKELEDLYSVCRKHKLPLFIDGARLGYGLMSQSCDIEVREFAHLCDIFYIGGTKIGALCGEAVVFMGDTMPQHFMTIVKQNGALLAKGRLIGIQFMELFDNNLYFKLSTHAIEMAMTLKEALLEKGYQFFLDSPTNQQFVIVDNVTLQKLQENVRITTWEKYDDTHTVVRFVTSWATTKENIDFVLSVL